MVGILLANVAFAADVDGFDPSSSVAIGLGTPLTESPTLGREGLSADVIFANQEDLVVFKYDDGDVDPILSQLVGTSLHGGWTIGDKARVDAFIPFYLYARAPEDGYNGPAFGDIRLQGTLPLVGEADDLFQFGVVPRITLPTGTNRAYVGKAFDVGATAAFGGATTKWGWTGNLGIDLTPAQEIGSVSLGSALEAAGGGWYNLDDHVRVGADLGVTLGLPKKAGRNNVIGTWDVFAQANTHEGLGLILGVGGGLINGLGAPEHRVFAGVTWGTAIRDQDKDGIWDDKDACVTDPEDFDQFEDENGCPDADNDGDKILDLVDVCKNDPEDFDDFADNDGCPEDDNDHDYVKDVDDLCPLVAGEEKFKGCPDTDADGLQDSEDECPTEPGKPEFNGCPDRDNDRVPDKRDACPDEPAPPEEDPALSDGCPKKAFYIGGSIKIMEKVNFAFNKATIDPVSFPLLDAVADVLKKYPWILKIEVAGHTDDVGRDSTNLRLSQQRVDSVMAYLVQKGIAKERLTAKGYGETKPIDTNRTEAGRANNRRVEFTVLQQEPPAGRSVPGGALGPTPAMGPKPGLPAEKTALPAAPAEKPALPEPPVEKAPEKPAAPAEKAPEKPAAPAEKAPEAADKAKPTLDLKTPTAPTAPATVDLKVPAPTIDLSTPKAPPPVIDGTRTAPAVTPTPAKPSVEPTKPAEPAKPAAEPAKPAAEPAKPAAEPAKPVEPAKPAAEPAKPAAAPAAGGFDPWGTPAPATPSATPTPAAKPVEDQPWGATPAPATTGPDGLLTVKVTGAPWADVFIDEVRVSRVAPFSDVPIKPGRHEISVINSRTGFKYTTSVVVEPGKPLVVDAKAETEAGPWGNP